MDLVNAAGAEYLVLSRKATTMGTQNEAGEANYVSMVRPITGRAFDLVFSQEAPDRGAYTFKK